MKKISILFVALATTGLASMAQQTKFGFKAGIQSTSLRYHAEENDDKINVDGTSTGFLIGGVADIPLSSKFVLQPNLLFAFKNGSLLLGSGKTTVFSIDIPLNLLYRNNGFFVGAGPNFSYGLSAKLKPYDDALEDTDLYEEEGGTDAPFKRFEFGVNALMGYEFASGFTLSANFTPGLSNLLNEADDDTKVNNRMFGISFGYMFGKAKAAKK